MLLSKMHGREKISGLFAFQLSRPRANKGQHIFGVKSVILKMGQMYREIEGFYGNFILMSR